MTKQQVRNGLQVVTALLLLGLIVQFASIGEFGFWQTVGHATGTRRDLGPIDFVTFTRRERPNDALACLADTCTQAPADVAPALYTIPAARLKEKLLAGLSSEPRLTRLADVDDLHLRFVQVSSLMRFPDVVDVLIVPRSSGASTMMIYSRGALGPLDLGANRNRIERWLAIIGQ